MRGRAFCLCGCLFVDNPESERERLRRSLFRASVPQDCGDLHAVVFTDGRKRIVELRAGLAELVDRLDAVAVVIV